MLKCLSKIFDYKGTNNFRIMQKKYNKIKSFAQIVPYSNSNLKLLHILRNLTINNLTIAFFENQQQTSIIYYNYINIIYIL